MIPKFPRILVYSLLVGGCLALIPPVVFARMRATPSPNRPIHIFYDMDFQSKYKPQEPNPLFADGRAMRAPVPGTVARGESYADSHLFEGVVDGQWAATLPEGIQMDAATLARGQQRFNIYCSVCHGYAGFGDGAVNKRAMELMSSSDGPANGTSWVQAKSLHDPVVREHPLGMLYSIVGNGIRNMAGYGTQIDVADRWAIAAYVKSLQLSQNASVQDVPPELRDGLKKEVK